jgi:diguanylate cyclase (GGDEF)-like protein
MDEKSNTKEQLLVNPPARQDNAMQDIENMITGLLKNAINEMQVAEMNKRQSNMAQDASNDGNTDALSSHVDITDLKKTLSTVQKFLDNVSAMISRLEGDGTEQSNDDEIFLSDYMAAADNIIEITAFSTKDSFTGLSNRYGFDSRLVLEWNRAAREKSSLCLLLFGVDGFNFHEEAYGREQREDVLLKLSRTLEHSINRATDFVARWSDVEFAVLLPMTDANGAMIVAERIRTMIEELNIPFISEKGGKLTAYIGMSIQTPQLNESPSDHINKAHNALNKAREASQNKIIIDSAE